MPVRHLPWMLFLSLFGAGCLMTTGRQVNQEVQELAIRCGESSLPTGSDLLPPPAPTAAGPFQPPPRVSPSAEPDHLAPSAEAVVSATPGPHVPELVATRQVAHLSREGVPLPKFKLEVPADLPGGSAPPIEIPEGKEEQSRFLKKLYPAIPPLPPEPLPARGPEGRPMNLADLQRLAEKYSPAIKNAEAAVKAACGAAYHVGQYPNPTGGFEYDTVQTIGGYPGGYIDQVIKTGGKLALQQAAAIMDVLNAKLALRRAKSDLRYQVRGYYFAVLVAIENARASDALYRFAAEIYQVQVSLLQGGFAAAYEPMQLRPLVLQAQLNVYQARNQYRASWRQLAAALGLPDMPPSELEGTANMPVPVFQYEEVKGRLAHHTDVLTAQVSLQQSKYNLKFQRVQPMPDVEVRLVMQKDYTAPPSQIANSSVMSAVIPIWYQNQGAIRQAEWLMAQAAVGPAQAHNALIVTLADAFNRYQTAIRTVEIIRQQIQDQVRVYRGLYARRQSDPANVLFADLVTAQQTLAGFISGYFTALGLQWQAVVDVANLLQTEELFPAGLPPPRGTPNVDILDLLPARAPVFVGPPSQAKGGADHEPMGPPAPQAPRLPAMLPSEMPTTSPECKRGMP